MILSICFYQGLSNPACGVSSEVYYAKTRAQKYIDTMTNQITRNYIDPIPTSVKEAGFAGYIMYQKSLSVKLTKHINLTLSQTTDTIGYCSNF